MICFSALHKEREETLHWLDVIPQRISFADYFVLWVLPLLPFFVLYFYGFSFGPLPKVNNTAYVGIYMAQHRPVYHPLATLYHSVVEELQLSYQG
jgi:hypothetical protein